MSEVNQESDKSSSKQRSWKKAFHRSFGSVGSCSDSESSVSSRRKGGSVSGSSVGSLRGSRHSKPRIGLGSRRRTEGSAGGHRSKLMPIESGRDLLADLPKWEHPCPGSPLKSPVKKASRLPSEKEIVEEVLGPPTEISVNSFAADAVSVTSFNYEGDEHDDDLHVPVPGNITINTRLVPDDSCTKKSNCRPGNIAPYSSKGHHSCCDSVELEDLNDDESIAQLFQEEEMLNLALEQSVSDMKSYCSNTRNSEAHEFLDYGSNNRSMDLTDVFVEDHHGNRKGGRKGHHQSTDSFAANSSAIEHRSSRRDCHQSSSSLRPVGHGRRSSLEHPGSYCAAYSKASTAETAESSSAGVDDDRYAYEEQEREMLELALQQSMNEMNLHARESSALGSCRSEEDDYLDRAEEELMRIALRQSMSDINTSRY